MVYSVCRCTTLFRNYKRKHVIGLLNNLLAFLFVKISFFFKCKFNKKELQTSINYKMTSNLLPYVLKLLFTMTFYSKLKPFLPHVYTIHYKNVFFK